MTTATLHEHPELITRGFPRTTTGVAASSLMTRDAIRRDKLRRAWDEVVFAHLTEWAKNPAFFAEDDLPAFSPRAIAAASGFAKVAKANEVAPPESIFPDASGGIVFQFVPSSVRVQVWDDGQVEIQQFDGPDLVHREPLADVGH